MRKGGEASVSDAFTLETGNTTSGDLVVFGGPVPLEKESYFDGDLTVFGVFVMEKWGYIGWATCCSGRCPCMQVWWMGMSLLPDQSIWVKQAYIDGDFSVVGDVSQDEGAIVVGEIIPIDKDRLGFSDQYWCS